MKKCMYLSCVYAATMLVLCHCRALALLACPPFPSPAPRQNAKQLESERAGWEVHKAAFQSAELLLQAQVRVGSGAGGSGELRMQNAWRKAWGRSSEQEREPEQPR
jgi:hypothetical protein